jgi:hypothetical protein
MDQLYVEYKKQLLSKNMIQEFLIKLVLLQK